MEPKVKKETFTEKITPQISKIECGAAAIKKRISVTPYSVGVLADELDLLLKLVTAAKEEADKERKDLEWKFLYKG